jgi:hypothetical protein
MGCNARKTNNKQADKNAKFGLIINLLYNIASVVKKLKGMTKNKFSNEHLQN